MIRSLAAAALLSPCFCCAFSTASASAQVANGYYSHVIFANSLTPDRYFYSQAQAENTSTISTIKDRLPVDSKIFHTPPNALRLAWQSNPNGGWSAQIARPDIRNLAAQYDGDTLMFWCYAEQSIRASELPLIQLTDAAHGFSRPVKMGDFVEGLPRGKWVEVRIPLAQFKAEALRGFDASKLESLSFIQNATDAARHSLIVDDIKIEFAGARPASLPPPANVHAKGYDRHIDISWNPVSSAGLQYYLVLRSQNGKDYQPIGIQIPGIDRYEDFLGRSDETAHYEVEAVDRQYRPSRPSAAVSASTRALSDGELLSMVEEACFRYYWDGGDPNSGMAKENIPGDNRIDATGASGFGIMALLVGVDRGFVTRQQGVEHLTKILNFLEKAPRYHGAWAHFTMDTRRRAFRFLACTMTAAIWWKLRS